MPYGQSAALNSANRGRRLTRSPLRRVTCFFARPRKEPPLCAASESSAFLSYGLRNAHRTWQPHRLNVDSFLVSRRLLEKVAHLSACLSCRAKAFNGVESQKLVDGPREGRPEYTSLLMRMLDRPVPEQPPGPLDSCRSLIASVLRTATCVRSRRHVSFGSRSACGLLSRRAGRTACCRWSCALAWLAADARCCPSAISRRDAR